MQIAILKHYMPACYLKRSRTLSGWLSALNAWTWRDWLFLWKNIYILVMVRVNKIILLPHTCSFSKLRNLIEAKTQVRLRRISYPCLHSPTLRCQTSQTVPIPQSSSPSYIHERKPPQLPRRWTVDRMLFAISIRTPSASFQKIRGIACHDMSYK